MGPGAAADEAIGNPAGGCVTGLEAFPCVAVAEDPAISVDAAIAVFGATAYGAGIGFAAGGELSHGEHLVG